MIISTGNVELDQMIDGGLRTKYCYSVKGTAGAGKTVLSLFIALGVLKQDIPVLFISTEVEPDRLIEYTKSFEIDISPYLENDMLRIEKMTLKPTGVNLVQTDKFDLSAIIARTKHIIESIGAKVIIFDSISAFIADFEFEKTARSKFMDFIKEITNLDTTLILTSEIREGEDKATLEEYLVDGVIKIRTDMQNQQLVKYISVPKLRSAKPAKVENTLIIDKLGFTILEAESKPISKIEGETLGIKRLDELLGGGFPSGSVVLIENNGEIDYFPLFLSTLYHSLHQKKGVIIHSNVQMYSTKILEGLIKAECDITQYLNEGSLVFIDKFNRSVTSNEAREISQLLDTDDMISVTVELMEAFERANQKVTLFGDLTDDVNILSESDFLRLFALQSFNIKERGAISFSFINFNAISREILARLRNTADVIIRFSKSDYSKHIECIKSSTGATFLPRVVKYKRKYPLIEILD